MIFSLQSADLLIHVFDLWPLRSLRPWVLWIVMNQRKDNTSCFLWPLRLLRASTSPWETIKVKLSLKQVIMKIYRAGRFPQFILDWILNSETTEHLSFTERDVVRALLSPRGSTEWGQWKTDVRHKHMMGGLYAHVLGGMRQKEPIIRQWIYVLCTHASRPVGIDQISD